MRDEGGGGGGSAAMRTTDSSEAWSLAMVLEHAGALNSVIFFVELPAQRHLT